MRKNKNNKTFLKNRALKIERKIRRVNRKIKLRNIRKKEANFLKATVKNYYKRSYDRPKTKRFKPRELWSPQRLSLQFGFSEEVLKFINNLKKFGDKYNHIYLRLDNVTDIGEGAIAMLLSVINELNMKGIYVTGKNPSNLIARTTLEKSGFFRYMSESS